MKILIVDDEIAALTKMKVLLSDYGECTMTTHADQALQLFENALNAKAPFDLVAIDIQLSQASGLDMLETFNKMEFQFNVSKSIKLMITASGTKKNLIDAYTKGCDGFFVKPVKRDAFEEKMHQLGLMKKDELPNNEQA